MTSGVGRRWSLAYQETRLHVIKDNRDDCVDMRMYRSIVVTMFINFIALFKTVMNLIFPIWWHQV